MSDDVLARSRRITRRTFGISALAALGFALGRAWPSLFPATGLDALAGLPDAAALTALGARPDAAALSDVEARLDAKLGDGYAAAIAADRASGKVLAVDGWQVPETQLLAAAYLAKR